MASIGRRELLAGAAAGLALRGCGTDARGASDAGGRDAGGDGGAIGCDDPTVGTELLSVVPILDTTLALDVPIGEGEAKRLYRDLSLVDADSLETPRDLFYLRTGFPPELDPDAWAASWSLGLTGLVTAERTITLADLQAEEREMGPRSLECSGNHGGGGFGLLSSARWSGVPIETVLDWASPSAGARVEARGISRWEPTNDAAHTSWIYAPGDLVDAGAFLALGMNGRPLPLDHGAPCRLLVPRWYGCACVKWLRELAFVADDVPASEQMLEYAVRTHQPDGVALARDFIPSVIDVAAVVTRVEKRRRGSDLHYLVRGVLWGGTDRVTSLVLLASGAEIEATICPPHQDNDTWALWWAEWRPERTGTFELACRVDEVPQRQRRLDTSFYSRPVAIDEL